MARLSCLWFPDSRSWCRSSDRAALHSFDLSDSSGQRANKGGLICIRCQVLLYHLRALLHDLSTSLRRGWRRRQRRHISDRFFQARKQNRSCLVHLIDPAAVTLDAVAGRTMCNADSVLLMLGAEFLDVAILEIHANPPESIHAASLRVFCSSTSS